MKIIKFTEIEKNDQKKIQVRLSRTLRTRTLICCIWQNVKCHRSFQPYYKTFKEDKISLLNLLPSRLAGIVLVALQVLPVLDDLIGMNPMRGDQVAVPTARVGHSPVIEQQFVWWWRWLYLQFS